MPRQSISKTAERIEAENQKLEMVQDFHIPLKVISNDFKGETYHGVPIKIYRKKKDSLIKTFHM
jgi:hypothetical protein